MKLRLLTTAIAVAGLAGCSLSEQSAPGLTGPSTLGRSVVLIASPDRILYDGSSQATITATVRNAAGGTEANVALHWEAAVVQIVNGTRSVTPIPVEPSPQMSSTGSNGTATTVVRAPIAPDILPAGVTMLEVAAIPIGDDASQLAPGVDAKPRFIAIELVPQTGSGAPDRRPVPDFTISPPVATIFQTVTFDASLTRDEGVVCGDRCTYTWDFGSNVATKNGRVVTVAFPTVATINVTLFVTDERGGTASKSQSIRINGPAAPVAAFTATPTSVKGGSGAAILLDASSTTVGAGATIVDYTWDFGDGSPAGTGQVTSHFYGAVVVTTNRTVTLTVTDDLGRKSQRSSLVTVTP